MSFTDLAGQRVDVAEKRLDVLTAAEEQYIGNNRLRRRNVAILKVREGWDWSFGQLAHAHQLSRGQVCRIVRQVKGALQKISCEIFSDVALSQKEDQ